MARSVLIFEWMVGGGLYRDSEGMPDIDWVSRSSLMSEGSGMLRAIAEDFAQAEIEPLVFVDRRFDGKERLPGENIFVDSESHLAFSLIDAAERADWILLIAPESDGRLLWLLDHLRSFADKLLSPNRDFVELTTDKSKTIERLGEAGVKIPLGDRLDDWLSKSSTFAFAKPAVLKPNDGAGSEGVQIISLDELRRMSVADPEKWRIEELVEGESASVSVLCGGGAWSNYFFDPTRQIFSEGHWVDCEVVTDSKKIERAKRLAESVVLALPKTIGYVGIDFIFGESAADDTVIEVNPRLTSSYLRLRDHVEFNIAERMPRLCQAVDSRV